MNFELLIEHFTFFQQKTFERYTHQNAIDVIYLYVYDKHDNFLFILSNNIIAGTSYRNEGLQNCLGFSTIHIFW